MLEESSYKRYHLSTSLQVMDNQYVPWHIYRKLYNSSLADFEGNPKLFTAYLQSLDTELKKILLFSETVFVNRAYFINSHILAHYTLGDEQAALFELLHKGIIRPILFNEPNFISALNKTPFSASKKKERILTIYEKNLREVHPFTHESVFPTETPGGMISARFKHALADCLDGNGGNILNKRCATLRRFISDIKVKPLKKTMVEIAGLAASTSARDFNRELLYKKYICDCDDGLQVADGCYNISKNTFAIKAWIDAVYNENVAMLYGHKIAFPQNMPTGQELGVDWLKIPGSPQLDKAVTFGINEDLSNRTSCAFREVLKCLDGQDKVDCISYENLSLRDIIHIRETGAWKLFISGLNSFINTDSISAEEFLNSYMNMAAVAKIYERMDAAPISKKILACSTAITIVSRTTTLVLTLLKLTGNQQVLDIVSNQSIISLVGVLALLEKITNDPEWSMRVARGITYIHVKGKRFVYGGRGSIDYAREIEHNIDLKELISSLKNIRDGNLTVLLQEDSTSVE